MKKNRLHELGKSRVSQLQMADVYNGTMFGILALWTFWVSTSLLIRYMQ